MGNPTRWLVLGAFALVAAFAPTSNVGARVRPHATSSRALVVPTYASYEGSSGAGNDAHSYWIRYDDFTLVVTTSVTLDPSMRWSLRRVAKPQAAPGRRGIAIVGSLSPSERATVRANLVAISVPGFAAWASSTDRHGIVTDLRHLHPTGTPAHVSAWIGGSAKNGTAYYVVRWGKSSLQGSVTGIVPIVFCEAVGNTALVGAFVAPPARTVAVSVAGHVVASGAPATDVRVPAMRLYAVSIPIGAHKFTVSANHRSQTYDLTTCLDF